MKVWATARLVACIGMALAFATPIAWSEEEAKPQILFTDVNIFDGKTDTLAEGMSVLVKGNLIKKIAKGDIEARDDATVIDGGGRILMPGLIDNHVHLMLPGPTLPAMEANST
jgi:imidazolonepropionase-like amidohydrolase